MTTAQKPTSPTTKLSEAEKIIKSHANWSITAGILPIPIIDFGLLFGIQLGMIRKISKLYEMPFSDNTGKALIASLVGSGVPNPAGFGHIGSTLKIIPGVGNILGLLFTPAFAWASTYTLGRVFIQQLESGNTFLNFDPNKVREYYRQEFEQQYKTRTATAPTNPAPEATQSDAAVPKSSDSGTAPATTQPATSSEATTAESAAVPESATATTAEPAAVPESATATTAEPAAVPESAAATTAEAPAPKPTKPTRTRKATKAVPAQPPVDTSSITSLWPNGRAYMFKGSQYSRYNVAMDRVDSGYPLPIQGNWAGLPNHFQASIDAQVIWTNGKHYLFKGAEYISYDIATDKADAGYPKPIADNWPGLWEDGIDAAVVWSNGKAYFFRGSEYIQYDLATNQADPEYPKPILGNWPGFPEHFGADIDAIFRWSNGKVYFFKGREYIRFDMASHTTDAKYPLPVQHNWPGLWAEGVDA